MKNSSEIDETASVPWWEVLGLPTPEMSDSQHISSSIVLLGQPGVGKRALFQRLSTIASHHHLQESQGSEHLASPPHSIDTDSPTRRKALRFADIGAGAVPSSEGLSDQPERISAAASENFASMAATGTGVCHDFIIQKLPVLSSHRARSVLPVNRRVVEFFCCDCAGALSVALPTIDSLNAAVLLVVIDLASPNTVTEQLDWCFNALEKHTNTLIQEQVSNNEVFRVNMMDAAHSFWVEEEEKLHSVKNLLKKNGTDRIGEGEKNLLLSECASLCPLRCIIVCTNLDRLESFSLETDTGVDLSQEPLAPSLKRAVENTKLTVRHLVTQVIRQYAMSRRCALAAVSSRLMLASGGENDQLLSQRFFKNFWSYIEYLLESYATRNATLEESVTQSKSTDLCDIAMSTCNSNFFPYFLIPCGLDNMNLLNSFVAAETFALSSGSACQEEPVMSSVLLHQKLLEEKAQEYLPGVSSHIQNDDEEKMIWDSI